MQPDNTGKRRISGRARVAAAALGTLITAAGGAAWAAHANSGNGLRLDDRSRDTAVCGGGGDNNQCDGAEAMIVVPNPDRREYALIWQGWYTDVLSSEGVRLYGRVFDAASGRPEGPSVELAQSGFARAFAATYDPATHSYVLAWQPPSAPAAIVRELEVQRFDEALRPTTEARTLAGNLLIKALVPETGGRVAVIATEDDYPADPVYSVATGPLTLHVETLDAQDDTVSITTRSAGAYGASSGVAAAYEPSTANLLVAWAPAITPQGAEAIRIDRIDPAGAGDALTLPITPGRQAASALACNPRRGDCLLVYAGGGPAFAGLHAQLLAPDGTPTGANITVADNTRGPIGVGADGDGYAFAWNQDGVVAPSGSHIRVARVTGSPPRITNILDRTFPGQARFAVSDTTGSGLLVWPEPAPHPFWSFFQPSWNQIRGQIVPL